MESQQSYDMMLQVNLATYASACDSADGKVERRRNDGWNVAEAERPSANRRRKHTDYSLLRDAARDERAFLRNETGVVEWETGPTISL